MFPHLSEKSSWYMGGRCSANRKKCINPVITIIMMISPVKSTQFLPIISSECMNCDKDIGPDGHCFSRWEDLLLRSLLGTEEAMSKNQEMQTTFLLLTSLDNSFVGQNVRLLIMEKQRGHRNMPPNVPLSLGQGEACLHLLFHIGPYCSITGKPQAK